MDPMSQRLANYARFIKVEHTLFALPLLFAGAILAGKGWPSWSLSGLIILAGFGARTAAFALNRIIDRHIDRLNPRTVSRELPSGKMSLNEAWGVGIFGTLVYLGAAWAIAPICFYLSPIPLLVFAVYPYLKRHTPMAHFGVGLADALAPLGGWLAVSQSLEATGPVLGLAVFTFLWVSGFDIIYATLDEDSDKKQGIHSMPAWLGREIALQVSALLHLAAFMVLIVLYLSTLRSVVGLITLLAIGALLYLEHMLSDDVDLAFFRMNAILGFGIMGFVALGAGGIL